MKKTAIALSALVGTFMACNDKTLMESAPVDAPQPTETKAPDSTAHFNKIVVMGHIVTISGVSRDYSNGEILDERDWDVSKTEYDFGARMRCVVDVDQENLGLHFRNCVSFDGPSTKGVQDGLLYANGYLQQGQGIYYDILSVEK